MKKVLLVLSIAFVAFTSKAQDKKFSFSLGGGIGSGSSSGGDGSTFGFGIDAQATTDFTETIQGFAQTGYYSFSKDGVSTGFMPILVGAKYKAGALRPGLGIGFGSYSGGGASVSGFTFSPQIGYNLDKLDIILHYTSTSVTGGSYNIFGAKVLYQIF